MNFPHQEALLILPGHKEVTRNFSSKDSLGNIVLSVVMPCLNEELTLGICIEKIQRTGKQNGMQGEIIVADNGSTDRSCAYRRKNGRSRRHVKEKGYGSAHS